MRLADLAAFALVSLLVVPDLARVCTVDVPLVVPLRVTSGRQHATSVKLQTRATTYEGMFEKGVIDKDKLTLTCRPSS